MIVLFKLPHSLATIAILQQASENPKIRSTMFGRFFPRSSQTPPNSSENNQPVRSDETQQSTESSPAHIPFPIGLKVLHGYPDATVDICFVHGLTGNRESTWTAAGQSEPWPKTLLPPELSNARILTYGYDAYVLRRSVASNNRLKDHARNLVNALTADRASINASTRALIFVAHSLGGLVCKKALLFSRSNREVHLRGIFESTKGIVFMGTPHKGSWMADWANFPAKCLGVIKSANTRLLDTLGQNDEMLKEIQDEFCAMIGKPRPNGRDIKVTCFYEELGFPIFNCVVPQESATLPGGYSVFAIHANHRDMVKFASREDAGFKDLCGELVRWEKEINEEIAKDLADQQQQQQQQPPPPADGGSKRQGNTSSSPSMEQGQSGYFHTGNNYNSGSGQQIQSAHFHGDMRF